MIRFFSASYLKFVVLFMRVQGFYAAPTLHLLFTSVFAVSGFAYGYIRGQVPDLHPEVLWALILGLFVVVIFEVYIVDGLYRLKIRTFVPRIRFVNSMFESGRLRFDRSVQDYERLLYYLTDYGKNRMYYGPLHIGIVVAVVIIYDRIFLKTGNDWLYLKTALIALPIHIQFLYVTGDLHMGKYRSLVKRQLFFLGHEPPNQFAISLKSKFISILFVIALSDYILVSLLQSKLAQTQAGYTYMIGFAVFSLALLMLLTALYFSTIFASIKELQLAANSLQEGHDPDFYSRTSDKELANLATGFFNAAQKVLNYRRDLEHQIRIATEHLQKANSALQQKDDEMQTELDFAAEIQKDIFPLKHAPWHAIQFGFIFQPMNKVSGDFMNIYEKDKAIYVLSADVSGHGVPAALITMAANDAFKLAIRNHDSIPEIFREVNEQLCEQIKTQDYLTAFLIRIDEKMTMHYSNASHQKALHYHAKTNSLESYDTGGLFLGAMPDASASYEEKISELHSGDRIILFTDGVTEQTNPDGEEFGHDRLRRLILETLELPIQSSLDRIYAELKKFAETERMKDDVSIMGLSVLEQYREFIENFNRALVLLKSQLVGEASKLLEQLWQTFPDFPGLPILAARIYFQLKDFSKAEFYAKQHLEKRSDDPKGLELLAAVALQLGNQNKARILIGRLEKIQGQNKAVERLRKRLK